MQWYQQLHQLEGSDTSQNNGQNDAYFLTEFEHSGEDRSIFSDQTLDTVLNSIDAQLGPVTEAQLKRSPLDFSGLETLLKAGNKSTMK